VRLLATEISLEVLVLSLVSALIVWVSLPVALGILYIKVYLKKIFLTDALVIAVVKVFSML